MSFQLNVQNQGAFYYHARLTNYSLKLYGSQQYLQRNSPIRRVEDLSEHRFVDYIDDLVYSSALYRLERRLLQLTACFRSNSILAQQIAVSAGAGLAILPRFNIAVDQPELQEVLRRMSTLPIRFGC